MDEEEYDAGEEEEDEEGEDADGGARAGPGAVVRSVVRGADGVLVDAGVEPVVGLVRRAADRVQFRVTPGEDTNKSVLRMGGWRLASNPYADRR